MNTNFVKRQRSKSISKEPVCIITICKSIDIVYCTNSTHKFLHSGLLKYFCMGGNCWRVSNLVRNHLSQRLILTINVI